MTRYGYAMYTFQIHHHGKGEDPLTLGALQHPAGSAEADAIGWKNDAIQVLAGVLRGAGQRVEDRRQRHLAIKTVTGVGRTIRFTAQLGTSGLNSDFIVPDTGDDEPVFTREGRHIETEPRRAMLVVPTNSKTGLLALEVRGRATGREQIQSMIKRSMRHHTQLIMDFEAVVSQEALQKYLEQASVHNITLRRTGLPSDVADAVELGPQQSDVGFLKMIISPGSLKTFVKTLPDKFRTNPDARGRLLRVGGLDFQELSIQFDDGERQTTMEIAADQVPSFNYILRSRDVPKDDEFYNAVLETVSAIAQPTGVVVGAGWQAGQWQDGATSLRLPLPTQEVPVDDSPLAGS
jgi:hypothetical protein